MQLSDIVETNDEMTFTMKNVDKSIANALRRTLLSDIPCVIMRTMPTEKNDVNITVNTSRFNNEILKQRLSCIPVHINDLSTPIENLQIELDVENDTMDYRYVTTEDIMIRDRSTNNYLKKDDVRDIFPPNPQTGYYIDILVLRPRLTPDATGEKITFTASLSIGTAEENSMFNSVSTCCYGNTPDKAEIEKQMKIREQELKDSETERDNIKFHLENWRLLNAQRIFIENSFDFTIKTVGVFTCKELLKIACDSMIHRITNISKMLSDGEVGIDNTQSTIQNGFDIKLYNEDYTIGMLIQYLMYSAYYENTKTMTFCGFKKLHPHDDFGLLRIGYKDETNPTNVTDDLLSTLKAAEVIFQDIKKMV